MLGAMRFKNYIWPHNPYRFETSYSRGISCIKLPFSGHVVQDLGSCAKTFSGEGEFAGENAYTEFLKLAGVFSEGGAGVLVHPLWPGVNAVFEKLSVIQEPMENYVRYAFRFVEYSDGYSADASSDTAANSKSSIAAQTGQSLGEIAAAQGSSTAKLLKLNPDIKNPNELNAGQRIRTE